MPFGHAHRHDVDDCVLAAFCQLACVWVKLGVLAVFSLPLLVHTPFTHCASYIFFFYFNALHPQQVYRRLNSTPTLIYITTQISFASAAVFISEQKQQKQQLQLNWPPTLSRLLARFSTSTPLILSLSFSLSSPLLLLSHTCNLNLVAKVI